MNQVTSLVATGLLVSAAVAAPFSGRTVRTSDSIYSFEDIPPSSDLQWVSCYNQYQCANLEVPLDYADPSVGTTIIAWIRQEAANSTGQDVLYNPGGPSASGINTVLSGSGDSLIKAMGGQYNLVAFDPRGVNNSGPGLTCFPGTNSEQLNTVINTLLSIGAQASDEEMYASSVARGNLCTIANSNTTARYAGTSAVVQDMMHFTELQAALNGKDPKDAKIWFYGISYGTIVGQTLAAMFPDRIGRVIVDANVNGDQWYQGVVTNAVEDADKAMDFFFEYCAEAGPEKCAYAGNVTDAKGLRQRFDNLLNKMEQEPLIISNTSSPLPVMLTRAKFVQLLFKSIYAAAGTYSMVADTLHGLEKGDSTAYEVWNKALTGNNIPGPWNYTAAASGEAQRIITSIDAAGRYPIKNVDAYLEIVEKVKNSSIYFGEQYVAGNVLITAGTEIIPPESQLFPGFKKTKTNTPILFINTAGDPITPVSSAKHMSTFFEGSAVLVQNTPGHSWTDVETRCTKNHVSAYLHDGTLPKDGTVCEAETKPLVDASTASKKMKRDVFEHLF